MSAVRNKKNQAYLLSPWRSQIQWIGSFLLMVVTAALVAFIYLNTTAQAATIGRQIQEMQVNMDAHVAITDPGAQAEIETLSIEELSIRIAELEAQLAVLTSQTMIEQKAREMQMAPSDPDHVVYLYVPGYHGQTTANIAPPPRLERASASMIPAVYRQSLIEWMKMKIIQTSRMIFEEAGR